ncbi:MAG: hypothetical protein M5U16_05925 [Hyphomicrobium sp.]|nr:hypothetical protein [Hyphomicrobium sp.]
MGSRVEKSVVKVALSSVNCGPLPVMSMAIICPPRASPVRLGGTDSVPPSRSILGPVMSRTGELRL